jgi:PAS domain S-box-containing protein
MTRRIRALLVEQSQEDALLLVQTLRTDGFEVTSRRVETLSALSSALEGSLWDLVISNASLPGFKTLDALGVFTESGLDVPFVVVSDTISDESVVPLMRAGAHEYVLKENLSRLGPAVRRELEDAKRRRACRSIEDSYRVLVDGSPQGLIIIQESRVVFANAAAADIFGGAVKDLTGLGVKEVLELVHPDDRQQIDLQWRPANWGTFEAASDEARVIRREGGMRWLDVSSRATEVAGRPAIHSSIVDVTQRREREREFEAIATLATALRSARDRSEMVPLFLDQTMDLLAADAAALAMRDSISDDVVFESARGVWEGVVSGRLGDSSSLTHEVFKSGTVFVGSTADEGCRLTWPEVATSTQFLAGAPMIAEAVVIGVLWIGRNIQIEDDDVRVLNSIADVAASALRRSTLHEETKLRLQRLHALRSVDLAINTSHEVEPVLDVVLDQVFSQLQVDAACILRWDSISGRLTPGAVRGVSGSPVIADPSTTEVDGLADRVAREQRIIETTALGHTMDISDRDAALAEAGFQSYIGVPLVAHGEIRGVLELLHREPLAPDPELRGFLETVAWQAANAMDNAALVEEFRLSNVELIEAYDSTLDGWAHALELRDGEPEGHTRRVTDLTVELASAFGFDEHEIVQVRRGALLHDIGKMAIADSILLKPGPLDEGEWEIMREHPQHAADLLAPIPHLYPALDIPYSHHERWDGSGYPEGLESEQIPLAARLFAVVDVWDALRTNRPYRTAVGDDVAIAYLRENAGVLFDPKVVEVFLDMITSPPPPSVG